MDIANRQLTEMNMQRDAVCQANSIKLLYKTLKSFLNENLLKNL